MKSYELINRKNGTTHDHCYASNLNEARAKFEPKHSGAYTIICNGNDWEEKNVRFK